jgi:hypothetical protein
VGGTRIQIDDGQRRARLGRRHHLAKAAADVATAARSLVGLHSSDPASVYLAAQARVAGVTPDDVAAALYDERSLVRVLGMRRTMFVVPTDLARVIHAAVTQHLAAGERTRTIKMLTDAGVADAEAWLDGVAEATVSALRRRGEAVATQLRDDVAGLREKVRVGVGTKWEGDIGLSTRTLFLLATEGRIVRARPRGTWISTQYRWALAEDWLGEPLAGIAPRRAAADLLGAWLRAYGPGTLVDMKWWTGWTVAKTKAALADVGAVEVDLSDGVGFVLPGEIESVDEPDPWVALLPGLDSTVMGWKQRSWYLGDHSARLFDSNGNAGPTVWCDGRVVGGWAQRRTGEVVTELLDDVGRARRAVIDRKAAELEEWIGDLRVTPRFRTPLERLIIAED